MSDIKGIVNKPQFDKEVFKVGEAIKVNNKCYPYIKANAIITYSSPLEITATYYSEIDDECVEFNIGINDVVDGSYEIKFLKEEK